MHTVYIDLHVEITCQVRNSIPLHNRINSSFLFYAYVLNFEFRDQFKLLNYAPIRNAEIFNTKFRLSSPISESSRILLQIKASVIFLHSREYRNIYHKTKSCIIGTFVKVKAHKAKTILKDCLLDYLVHSFILFFSFFWYNNKPIGSNFCTCYNKRFVTLNRCQHVLCYQITFTFTKQSLM